MLEVVEALLLGVICAVPPLRGRPRHHGDGNASMHRAPFFATLDAWRSCLLCMNRMDVARIFDSASEKCGVQGEFIKQGTRFTK